MIRNLFNLSRAFFNKWLKWRSFSPFDFMLFCNLTPLGGRFINAIVFVGNSNFVNKLPLYTFNIQFMYDNLNSSVSLWNKLHLYFVTFLLSVSIYSQISDMGGLLIHGGGQCFMKYSFFCWLNSEKVTFLPKNLQNLTTYRSNFANAVNCNNNWCF